MNDDLVGSKEPFSLFLDWLREAEQTEPSDPNAMALATVDDQGLPDVRMVLLKACDARGFSFYTNKESAKGTQIKAHPEVALCFHWKSLGRQVRARGRVEKVSDDEADAYFQTRPRGSRIGAWASRQSRPVASRAGLEEAVAAETARFGEGFVPRPPYWGGFRLLPVAVEFWRAGPFRLHDRIRFRRADLDGPWESERLFP